VFHFCDSVATLAFFMFVFRHVIQHEPVQQVEDERIEVRNERSEGSESSEGRIGGEPRLA
jgi:hypothetical protein